MPFSNVYNKTNFGLDENSGSYLLIQSQFINGGCDWDLYKTMKKKNHYKLRLESKSFEQKLPTGLLLPVGGIIQHGSRCSGSCGRTTDC